MTKFNPRDPHHVHNPPPEQDDGDSTIVHSSSKTTSSPSGGYAHNKLDFDFSEDFGQDEDDEDGGDATMLSNTPPEFQEEAPPLEAQRIADRYELISLIGEGATGKVYRARDLELDDIIALKLLLPGQLHNPEILARFKREVRLSRKITHRNVARVFDLGEEGGNYYLTMELINGKSLDHVLEQRGTLPLSEAYDLAIQICEGLYAAHGVEVIHRDLKPENILVEYNGRAVITDFGIARHASGSRDFQTVVGSVIGTPAYMAPEQIATNSQIDARADIYAFGAILFEMVTGQQAWQGDNIFAIIAARLTNPPPDPRRYNLSLPTPLAELILRCMEREPAQRPLHIANVLQTLQHLRNLPQSPSFDSQATVASLDAIQPPTQRASSHTPLPSASIQHAPRQKSSSYIPVGTPIATEQKHTPPPNIPVASPRNYPPHPSPVSVPVATATSHAPRNTSPSYTHAEQSVPRTTSPSYTYAQQTTGSRLDSPLDVVAGTPSRHEAALQQDNLRAKLSTGTTGTTGTTEAKTASPSSAGTTETKPTTIPVAPPKSTPPSTETPQPSASLPSPLPDPADAYSLPAIPTLLLLPISGAPPHLAAYSEELARTLSEQLGLFSQINVCPPEVGLQTRGKNITLKQFHRDFGADLLLTLQIKYQQNDEIEINTRIQATVGGKILHTSRVPSSTQSPPLTATQLLDDLRSPLQLPDPQTTPSHHESAPLAETNDSPTNTPETSANTNTTTSTTPETITNTTTSTTPETITNTTTSTTPETITNTTTPTTPETITNTTTSTTPETITNTTTSTTPELARPRKESNNTVTPEEIADKISPSEETNAPLLSLKDDFVSLFPPSPSKETIPPLSDPQAIATDSFFGDDFFSSPSSDELFSPKASDDFFSTKPENFFSVKPPKEENLLFSSDSIGDDFLLPTSSIDEDFLSPLPPLGNNLLQPTASTHSPLPTAAPAPPPPTPPRLIASSKEALQQLLRAKSSLTKQWQGDLSETIALFEALQKDYPQDPAPLAGIATAKARQAFASSGPNDPPLQEAQKLAQSALSRDPDHPDALYALALIEFYRHAWDDALRHLAKLLQQGHPHPKAHALLGSIMLEIGSLGGAIDNLQHALALDPAHLTARFEIARGYAILEQWNDVDRLLALPTPDEHDERTRNLYQARLNLWRPDPQRLELSNRIATDNDAQQSIRILNHVRATKQFPKTLQHRFYQVRIEATKSLRLNLQMRQELIEILAFVQDWDAAFSVLQEALDLQLYDFNWLSRCPLFQSIQQDPRYLRFHEQLKSRALPLHKRLQETY